MKIFYSPLGGASGNPFDVSNKEGSLERKITIDFIKKNLGSDLKQNKKTLNVLSQRYSDNEKVIIWGFSGKTSKIASLKAMKEHDWVFFGYLNCLVYVGQVECVFKDNNLSEVLWNNKNKWEYKVIMKNLIRVYIPGSIKAYEDHSFIRSNFKDTQKIYKLISNKDEKRLNFRKIINKEGNYSLQGTQMISDEKGSKQILENLDLFFIKSGYESLGKTIL